MNNFFKNTNGHLPNLIIIGSAKCGTTSLHQYLNLHPDVIMSREKELDFFVAEKNLNQGLDWYQKQFQGQAIIYGESSPNYSRFPIYKGVPQRICSTLPNVKLIYMLRNPIDRIISQYIHWYSDDRENRTFQEAFSEIENNIHIIPSLYFLQIKQYLDYFPSQKILVLTLDELSKKPQLTLEKVFKFLEVDPNFKHPLFKKVIHPSKDKRRKTSFGKKLAKNRILKSISYLPASLRWHIERIVYFPFSQKIEKPQLDQDLKQKLWTYLKDDIEQLQVYTGRDFSEWYFSL